jgi:hypothetical protein
MKIAENLQYDLSIVPTGMFWKKVKTNEGEFTILIIVTTLGAWGFFMPPKMVTDLRKGMEEMESPIAVAKQMPTVRRPMGAKPNGASG